MTKAEFCLSIIAGLLLGSIIANAFMATVESRLDARDAAMGIDRHAIIEEVLK